MLQETVGQKLEKRSTCRLKIRLGKYVGAKRKRRPDGPKPVKP